jgi:DNA topoisomerase-2
MTRNTQLIVTMDLSDKYRKQTHREHILSLPDTYIGSIETAEEEVWLPGADGTFHPQRIAVNPGFYKLVDELLVNSHDQVVRLRQNKSANPVKHINISYTDGILEVENDGESIDVAKHPAHDMYIPQLIFGELLTSTNYDKEEKKLVGGKNGYGVKLVNIFAKTLQVRVVDAGRALLYEQTFTDNMTKVVAPKVKASKAKSSVGIRWQPDYARFGYPETGLPVDMVRLIERRVCDLAMTVGKEVKVTWNGTALKCRGLADYAKAYCGGSNVLFESPNERWQIALAASQADHFFQSSFVNGIWTSKGGKHVDAVVDQVVGHVVEYLETKKKTKVRPGLVKDHLAVFIVSMIENPSFSSQTKETLTTKMAAFGSSPKLSEDTLKKVVSKLGIVETILAAQAVKDSKENTKTDGKKQSRITGIPKLDDAVLAGTKDSAKCTLILTEGDSAKAMALSGLSQEQRKFYGVYPLKGKVLNVKDTSDAKVEQTKEIAELKKILGLQSGKKYEDVSGLSYGSVMIMTDQDYDGAHIRGLLINLFHELWHELVAIPGFITYMATPIVKATKGGADVKNFFSQYEYEQWRASPASKGYTVKYYKGLGTSTRDEAKGYFAKPQAVQFDFVPGSDEAIDLAFNKQRADDRKVWLQGYDKTALVPAGIHVPYTDFIHKDLIHFSNYNLERALPSVMDGLKVSQRKILYAAFKRDLKHEIRVAQFAGYVSEHTGYHHGEQSLNDAIVGMAQDFMGANNIPWLVPQGQFGTRLQGGKDSASPRYIHTYLQPNVRKLVSTADFSVLKYRDDDGMPVEPEWYAPILPMLLVNGARGIGTGYSTYIPPCNPAQLKTMLVSWLRGDDTALDAPIKPYFKGFKGTVSDDGTVVGVYRKEKEEFVVTELPPGTWTQDYREWLEKHLADGSIKDFTDTSTDTDINIRIKGVSEPLLLKSLTEKIKHTNMHAFNADGVVTKYTSPNAILSEYAEVRLSLYETRRQKLVADLKADLPYHEDVMRFIEDQIADEPTLDFRRKPKSACETELVAAKYRKVSETYDYIFRLPVSAFTAEQVEAHATKLASIRTEIARLESLEAADMWLHELSAV